jgi:hypothetical protein
MGLQSQGVQGRGCRISDYLPVELITDSLLAAAKHYINNEQEHFRETSSSNLDDR